MIDPANPDYANTPVAAGRPRFGYAPSSVAAPPAISIITPFFNTGDIFHETAQCVLQQSLQQWEWIIVNDGSTDPAALAGLDQYRERDPRIRVIDHESNRGLSAARNTGFRAAKTEFVLQLDSDDVLEPTTAEKWLWLLSSYPEYGFCGAQTVIFGARQFLRTTGFEAGSDFLVKNSSGAQSMIRRSLWERTGGYDEEMRGGLEDWEFRLRCAHAGTWGRTVPELLEWHRRRSDPTDHWQNLREGERTQAVVTLFHQRYGHLWQPGGFPQVVAPADTAWADVSDVLPCANRLRKDKPRLLLLTRCLPMGGGSAFNLDVLTQLTKRGWELTIATTEADDNSWLPVFAAHTPDIFLLPHFLRLADYPRFLRYLIQSRDVDAVLLASSDFGYAILPYLRAHFPDLPIVDYCHMENEERNNGGYPRQSLIHEPLLDATAVSSEHLKEWMAARGGDRSRIFVQYTNVDTDIYHPDPEARTRLRRAWRIADEIPVLLFVGRVVPQKQPRVIIRTIAALRERGLQFVLVIAGEGQDLPQLRAFVERNTLQAYVRLLGPIPLARVPQVMAASDILFLPSLREGIALTVFEAMACGLAIVGADAGGQSEVVTPECGILAAPHGEDIDVETYTKILADLLPQPERWQKMGRAAHARVASLFRLSQMGDGMIGLFEQARGRDTQGASAAPSLAVGRICAAVAVEWARLSRLPASGQPAALRAPRSLKGSAYRALKRAVAWGVTPDGRLAPAVRQAKRILPTRFKVFIKRAVG